MARETFTTLQTAVHDYTQTSSSDTTINTFVKSEINRSVRFIYNDMKQYINNKTQTASTVSGQQYYHYPPDLVSLENIVITIGSVDYTLVPVDSAKRWGDLNAINTSGTAIPSFFYPRRDDFGIYPTPQDAYTLTVEYVYSLAALSNEDYTTGTVTATNNSATVTGSSTSWSGNIESGQWFEAPDGLFYRINSVDSNTQITLESVYEGATASGETYTVGDSPEIPEDLHELVAYRATSMYYSGFRKDPRMASYWGNLFWTGDGQIDSRIASDAVGGYLKAKERYSKRSNTGIVYKGNDRMTNAFVDRLFATTLSSQ